MHEARFSVALPGPLEATILEHLIREDSEEDVLFALWYPSQGSTRNTALIHSAVWPVDGDRQRHGNASFNPQYLERVCILAMQQKAGIAFMHSHPYPGWQDMSYDDVVAERQMAGAVLATTGLPLVGLTVGSDATWSARFWEHEAGRDYRREWCGSVRSVGRSLRVSFDERSVPAPDYREEFKRTITVWGTRHHRKLARLKIGIVGVGSVGSFVAEQLARMGFTRLKLIDFDRIKTHNLDRTLFATAEDVGRCKIDVAAEMLMASATAGEFRVEQVPFSVAEEQGYRAALDCDVLFSCVDRPRARRILNHLALAHLIPVIDGGILVRFNAGRFSGVDWQLQTVTPGRACLECLAAYSPADVATETEGKLDDPSYLTGIPADHRFRQNENVMPFSANLASLEVLQLIVLATGIGGLDDVGVQRYRYNPGILERDITRSCRDDCGNKALTSRGDSDFELFGFCHAAEKERRNVAKGRENCLP